MTEGRLVRGALLVLMVWGGLILASRVEAGILGAYRDWSLANGLRVILVRETKSPVVVTQVWYRVGAVDEEEGRTGLAHLLEHMMFQGTEAYGPKEFNKLIAQRGGESNAGTSADFTYYYIKTAAEHLPLALTLEADRMRNLVLREQELAPERKVVQEERRSRIDGVPSQRMLERLRRQVFTRHPYGRPVIGAMDHIGRLQISDLQAWYRRYYVPDNAILVIVGAVDLEETALLVERHFGGLAAGPVGPSAVVAEPQQGQMRRVEVKDAQATVPAWVAAIVVPTLGDRSREREVLALDLLATLLGDSQSSRLYRHLVKEQELAVAADVDYMGVSRYPGEWLISVTPKEGVAGATIEAAVLRELAELRTGLVPQRELEKAKNSSIADHVFAQDSVDAVATAIGMVAGVGADWRTVMDQYPELVRSVTAEEIRQVADRYLRPERMTVGVLVPSQKASGR